MKSNLKGEVGRAWGRDIGLPSTLVVIGLLAGCGAKHSDKVSSQVAAKVDSYEITAYQVNSKLARVPSLTPDVIPAAKKQIVDGLIDQELAVEQAQVRKLDRTAPVQAALDDARREILARAYMESVANSAPKPTHEELTQYFNAHPELFSQRRIFSIKEITVKDSPEISEYAKAFVTSGKPIEQFGQWLQNKNIRFSANAAARAAETLPLDFLPKLTQAKDGGLVLFTTDQGLYMAQVMGSQQVPVTEQVADPSIARYIQNQRGRDAVVAETKRLRSVAKIEYGPAMDASAAPPVPAKSAADAAAAANAQPPAADVIKRGVGGLK